MSAPASSVCSWPASIRLTVSAGGECAGGLVSRKRRLLIGSGRRCDLALHDPLVPRRACRLRRQRLRAAAGGVRQEVWMLEAGRGSRVFCNGERVDRIRLRPGDRLVLGCHRILVEADNGRPMPPAAQERVAARCRTLLERQPAPAAFLARSADYQGRRRLRQASLAGLSIALLLLLAGMVFPPDQTFLNIQPPMQVVMVGEISRAPSPQAVRRLEQVERREMPSADPLFEQADLAEFPLPDPERPETPFAGAPPLPHTPPAPPETPTVPVPVPSPELPALTVTALPRERVEVTRPMERLNTPTPPRRRLTAQETGAQAFRAEALDAPLPGGAPEDAPAAAWRAVNASATPPPSPPAHDTAPAADRADNLRLLLAQQASPLTFETHQGTRIPIARIPDRNLALMEVRSEEAGVAFDGMVSDTEIEMSWKSGRFRIHGPNPQQADPPTYCYVGRRAEQGQEFLYVSFVCEDPDVGALRSGHPEGLWRDDSVELFLDTNANRRDYYHMIVNCRGQYTAAYCASGEIGLNSLGTPWNAQPRIRTDINAAARRWSVEIMIPFHALGGSPAKGSRWVVNFTRAFRGQGLPGGVYQNWFLVYNGRETNYHNPELFGVLEW